MCAKNELSTRFITAYETLLNDGKVSDKRDFAAKIGISPSMVTEISKGRSNVGTLAIQNIVSVFNINAEWLLTGNGPMLKSDKTGFSPDLVRTNPTKGENYVAPTAPTGLPRSQAANEIFLSLLRDKDDTIKQQAEEIGRLKEQIRQLTIEKEKRVSGAHTSHTANAG